LPTLAPQFSRKIGTGSEGKFLAHSALRFSTLEPDFFGRSKWGVCEKKAVFQEALSKNMIK